MKRDVTVSGTVLHWNATVGPDQATWGGHSVALVRLEPEPRAGMLISQDDYRVHLRIVPQ